MITQHIYKKSSLINNSINLIIIKRHFTNFNSNHLLSRTTLTVVTKSHLVIKRTMRRYVRQIINNTPNLISRPNGSTTTVRSYATDRVHTPIPTTSSNESLNNNPAIVFTRKKKTGTVIQHPEWVKDLCNQPGCAGKVCTGLCGEKIGSKSVGHFTHSEDDKHAAQKVADTDLDGEPYTLFVKPYNQSHETTGDSYNSDKDKVRTEKLKEYLDDIKNDKSNY